MDKDERIAQLERELAEYRTSRNNAAQAAQNAAGQEYKPFSDWADGRVGDTAAPASGPHKVICHAPGDRCGGCDHYKGLLPECIYKEPTSGPTKHYDATCPCGKYACGLAHTCMAADKFTAAHNALNLVDMLLVEAGFKQDSSVRHNLQIAKSLLREAEKG